jgi:hypothetical protein
MAYEEIFEWDKIELVSNYYFQGKVGNDIREFNDKFELLPLSQRKDFITIPEDMKIEGEEIISMTLNEKIDIGLIELSDREKYEEETEQIRMKTIDELFSDNLISKEEYTNIKLSECYNLRKQAYAMESDGLFFDYQRDEIDKQIWIDKVKEIKARYPKP